jgi:transcription antitermination factor NusG
VREIRGVVHVVSSDTGPVSLPDDEIESIRKLQVHGISCIESRSFATGQRVVVTEGPLKGLRGEVVRQKHRHLFVVKIQLIKRMLEVGFDPVDLQIASI